MAFTINPDGSIKVDTQDELRAVLALREQMRQPQAEANTAAKPDHGAADVPRPIRTRPEQVAGGHGREATYREMFEQITDKPQQQRTARPSSQDINENPAPPINGARAPLDDEIPFAPEFR